MEEVGKCQREISLVSQFAWSCFCLELYKRKDTEKRLKRKKRKKK
jgi:hypothetical protein